MMTTRRRSTTQSFVERHGLWTEGQSRRGKAVAQAIKKNKLELVRFSFADQHGVLRGKTLLADDAVSALRSGVSMTTTLLAKDTSHRSVFPVFTAGGGRRHRPGRRLAGLLAAVGSRQTPRRELDERRIASSE